MRIKSIHVLSYLSGQENKPVCESFWFNNDCLLEKENHPGYSICHYYLPNGAEYEQITSNKEGEYSKLRFDYDDSGDLIGSVETDKHGAIISRTFYDWIKPNRVVSVESIEYNGSEVAKYSHRKYHRKDGQVSYIRGRDYIILSEYDDKGHLRIDRAAFGIKYREKPEWTVVDKYNEDGLLVEHTNSDGMTGTMQYEFDELGNWIRMEGRIDGGPVSMIMTREIEYSPGDWVGKYSDYPNNVLCHITHNPAFRNR